MTIDTETLERLAVRLRGQDAIPSRTEVADAIDASVAELIRLRGEVERLLKIEALYTKAVQIASIEQREGQLVYEPYPGAFDDILGPDDRPAAPKEGSRHD